MTDTAITIIAACVSVLTAASLVRQLTQRARLRDALSKDIAILAALPDGVVRRQLNELVIQRTCRLIISEMHRGWPLVGALTVAALCAAGIAGVGYRIGDESVPINLVLQLLVFFGLALAGVFGAAARLGRQREELRLELQRDDEQSAS